MVINSVDARKIRLRRKKCQRSESGKYCQMTYARRRRISERKSDN